MPRFIDTYVDWLWFGELGYRSVFTTVLCHPADRLPGGRRADRRASCSPALALAYRTRPVFVPTAGPNDPVARYRTAVMARLRLFGIGVPAFIGVLAGFVAQSYWVRVQLFLHGGSFGITDPQFGMDLGFYAFDLPFYRLVLTYLFVATFLAFIANLLGHYLFGGIRLAGRTGALSRSARIQLISLVGILMLLKAVAYWLDRYELLSHTRGGKPFTGAGYTDINAVLPAKLILLAIAVICAAAVFSAIVLRDLRIPAIGVVLLLLSSLIVGAGWPLVVEQISVKPNAAQKESEYISRSIAATRQAYGLTENVGDLPRLQRQRAGHRAAGGRRPGDHVEHPVARPDHRRPGVHPVPAGQELLLLPRSVGDRPLPRARRQPARLRGGGARTEPGPADRQPAGLDQPAHRLHPRQRLHRLAGQHGARDRQRPQPERRLSGVPGQRRRRQRQRGLARARPAGSAPHLLRPGDRQHVRRLRDRRQERRPTASTTTRPTPRPRTTPTPARGGVPIGNWLTRSVFAAKFAERNFLFSNVIGGNSKILFNRDPAERVKAVAPWLTTDTAVYPAIVNKRMVWIVDGYTTLDNYPYSELTSLSSATADSNEVALNRLQPDKQVSYIRNSVKATVDAYDGTVTLYAQDEQDPVLQAWMKVFPGTVKPKSDITSGLQAHLRYPEDLFKVQRALLAKYHVNDPVTFFSTSDFWDVPLDPNPTASSYQPPYYIVAKDLAQNDNSASFQLTSAMNRFRRDFLAAYISASSDPETYGKITVLTIPGQVNGPKLAFNAISTDTAVSQDLGVIGRDNQNRIRWGNLLTLPVAEGGLLYVAPVYASPGASDAASSYPRLIRVAMMYNDKVGYGPTVSDALTELFGPGAGATATGPRRPIACRSAARRAAAPTGGSRGAAAGPAGPCARGADPGRGGAAGRSRAVVGGESRCAAGGQRGPWTRLAAGSAERRLRRVR